MTDQATGDVIFGTLATDELRHEALHSTARGISHASNTHPNALSDNMVCQRTEPVWETLLKSTLR